MTVVVKGNSLGVEFGGGEMNNTSFVQCNSLQIIPETLIFRNSFARSFGLINLFAAI